MAIIMAKSDHSTKACSNQKRSHSQANNSCSTRTKKKGRVSSTIKSNVANTSDDVQRRKISRRKNRSAKKRTTTTLLQPLKTKPSKSKNQIKLEQEERDKEEELQKAIVEARAIDLYQSNVEQLFEPDLTCLICCDVYINPMIINCSHSFCKFCIYQWLDIKSACPTCRIPFKFMAENLALKNIIGKMISKSSKQFQDLRTESESKRVVDESKLVGSQSMKSRYGNPIPNLRPRDLTIHSNRLARSMQARNHVWVLGDESSESDGPLFGFGQSSESSEGDVADDDEDEEEDDEDEDEDEDEDDEDDENEDDNDEDDDDEEDEDVVESLEIDDHDEADISHESSFYDRFNANNSDMSDDTDGSNHSDEIDETDESAETEGSDVTDGSDDTDEDDVTDESDDTNGSGEFAASLNLSSSEQSTNSELDVDESSNGTLSLEGDDIGETTEEENSSNESFSRIEDIPAEDEMSFLDDDEDEDYENDDEDSDDGDENEDSEMDSVDDSNESFIIWD